MGDTVEFMIGSDVVCRDGACGELKRVVVDPDARVVTHLVVEPRHRHGTGRLVPVDLVAQSGEETIRLLCTTAEFRSLDDAEELEVVDGPGDDWAYPAEQMMSLPHLGLGLGGPGGEGAGAGHMSITEGARVLISDRVPAGEVEVRRGARVHATDGPIGRVQGLLVDPGSHQVTHVVLDEGHLWGSKRVAIPIAAVTRVDEDLRLNLSKDQIQHLPAVDPAAAVSSES